VADPDEDTGLITDSQGNISGTLYGQGALIAVGGTNIDTGLANTLVLQAPDGATVINPVTTLVTQYMQDSSATATAAQAAVATALALPGSVDLLSFDALASAADPTNALAVQQANAQLAVTTVAATTLGTSTDTATVMSNLVAVINNAPTTPVNLADSTVLAQVTGLNNTDATTLSTNNTNIQTATDLTAVSSTQLVAVQAYAGSNDVLAPQVSSFTPTDQATDVAVTQDLTLTFNEAIQVGSGTITLKTLAGDTFASYDANSANLTVIGNTLTLAHDSALAFNTQYVLDIAPGAIQDVAGNSYIGGATYQFTTLANPGTQLDLQAYSWKTHVLLSDVSISAPGYSASTDASGAASFADVSEAALTLSTARAIPAGEASLTDSAVDLQDAIAILKMIVGLEVNGAGKPLSPYQALAADFDGNGQVQLTDAIEVLRHVVGLNAAQPAWHFVNDADPTIPAMANLNPGLPATSISAELGAGGAAVHVGLVGYLSGDVDGSYGGVGGALDLDVSEPDYFVNLTQTAHLNLSQFGVYS